MFLTSDGHVKILDFGLALQRLEAADPDSQTMAAHTAQGIVLGTFGYMSPEQVTGERVDGRTDIFALGCLLYEMLTGRQLFTGGTPQELIAKLLRGSAPDLSAFDPLAPQSLRTIVTRAVERQPERRFESAQDVAAALRGLLSGSAIKLPRAAKARGKSLAVLPFVNAADPKLDYLTDGITESIINSLSQLPSIRVVPRSVVFRYKGMQTDPSTVGMALNARTILTGRVTQHGELLSIQAELVDTGSRVAAVGRTVPPQAERADDGAGRDRVADLRGAAAQADDGPEDAAAEAGDRESGGVPGVSARPAPLEQLERRWLPARGRALPAGDRHRPVLRAGLCRPRRRARRDVVLRLHRAG